MQKKKYVRRQFFNNLLNFPSFRLQFQQGEHPAHELPGGPPLARLLPRADRHTEAAAGRGAAAHGGQLPARLPVVLLRLLQQHGHLAGGHQGHVAGKTRRLEQRRQLCGVINHS